MSTDERETGGRRTDEAVAIVGAGCRFPGGGSGTDGLWRLLRDGTDVITEVPATRWDMERYYDPEPGTPGTMYTRWGGFLPDVERFDAAFFGIAPREAQQMDPQQRLLLEVAWEALEDAGIVPGTLAGTRTAVFTGGLGADYFLLHSRYAGLTGIDPWYASGKEPSFSSGRLSYHLGLRGPSVSLSTTCSSSLVAVHLARQSLLLGESDAALIGGVNLLLAPELTMFMCQAGAMSPTGRCKVFDAAADGIVRGDGCAVLVLKRLGDALADGDDVLAVIRGSAVNHDGRSVGFTVPSTEAQQSLLEDALRSADMTPHQIGYVEAHGTGTPLGDPIEMYALGHVLGRGRPEGEPLTVGSVKTNLGHTDAAAGVAGLLKAALAVRNGEIPPHLHLDTPSRNIDWAGWRLTAPPAAAPLPWPGGTDLPRAAGVSAFGLSGTNAHVIVEQPPARPAPGDAEGSASPGTVQPSRTRLVLPLSARSGEALRELAAAHRDRLVGADCEAGANGPESASALEAYVDTAARRRTHHPQHRLAVVGADAAELAAELDAQLRYGDAAAGPSGDGPRRPSGAVFVFSGQGAQWPGMGRRLYEEEPVFRERLEACDTLIAGLTGWSVVAELTAGDESRLDDTEIAQPAVFAVQAALTALWDSWGVRPRAVVGHSMGEITAAYVAGVLSLEDAVRIVVHRGRLLSAAAGQGRMASAALPEADTAELLAPYGDRLHLAAANGPRSTVVAGEPAAVDAFAEEIRERGADCRVMPGTYAFHTPGLAPYGAELAELLAGLEPGRARVPLFSTVPQDADGDAEVPYGARHWARNVYAPVRFADAVEALLRAGHRTFLELGPHPVLAQPITQQLGEQELDGVVVPSLRRGTDDAHTARTSLSGLYARGVDVDFGSVNPRHEGPGGTLPRYPWQGERLWFPYAEPAPEPERAADTVPDALPDTAADTAVPEPAAEDAAPAAARDSDGLTELVGELVARALGLRGAAAVSRGQGFAELGMDSLGAVQLARSLERALGLGLPKTVALDHPTVDRLTAYLLPRLPQPGTAPQRAPEPVPAPVREPEQVREPLPEAGPPAPAPAAPVPAAPSVPPAPAGEPPAPEPIAVVGLGCRFPGGAEGPAAYWQMLRDGVDAIRTVPEDRFDGAGLWRGGFLDGVDRFDAPFFRIPPREARVMDPQQRLFLEVAWEALEHAGLPPTALSGTRTGVFLGMNSTDYGQLLTRHPGNVDAFYGTGNSFTAATGRLSYLLGLHGPSLAVDTACSSSLVAVHLAVRSLRTGESEVAVAGGVNLILNDTIHRSTSAMGALAADGRCKTFDAAADGYTRGEGCGLVVLKPLSAALADGDDVLAVVLGSAVNQDGASSGLTVPNGPAQEDLLRAALTDAHAAPAEIGYVEAHGTGTPLGDPIELQALGAVLGEREADSRCLVGSVKTNFGHLEAASGVAGLIKSVLALRHGEIPPHLHFREPSPDIPWDGLPVRVPTEPVPWGPGGARRVAGVSAFGFSGTNAHVVLAEAPPPAPVPDRSAPAAPDTVGEGTYVLPLSAASRPALEAQARAYGVLLAAGDEPPEHTRLRDLTYTAALRRSHLAHRLVAVGEDRAQLAERLGAFADGRNAPGLAVGQAGESPRRGPVFVFSGHGSYWRGACRDLMRHEPVFREAVESCDRELRRHLDWSVAETLAAGEEPGTELDQQFLLFAIQYALVELWRRLGVEPAAVTGHSMGEVSAALCAGALDLSQAVDVMVHRTEVLKDLMGTGAMAMVGLDAERTTAELAGYEDRLCVSVVNSYRSTVVSGETGALAEVEERMRSRNIFFRKIAAGAPAHSPLAEPLRARLVDRLAELTAVVPRTPLYSSVLGARLDTPPDADYWGRNLRQTVWYADAVRALIADGHDTFVELSPHPLQLTPTEHELDAAGAADPLLVPSLTRDTDGRRALFTALGSLHAAGRAVDWRRLHPYGGALAAAPRYPWQHKPYWVEHDGPPAGREPGAAGGHPLVGRETRTAGPAGSRLVEAEIDAGLAGRLGAEETGGDGTGGALRLPAAAWLEMALAAAGGNGDRPCRLVDVTLPGPCFMAPGAATVAQLAVSPGPAGACEVTLYARGADAAAPFRTVAAGRVLPGTGEAVTPPPDLLAAEWTEPGDGLARSTAAGDRSPRIVAERRGEHALEAEAELSPATLRWLCGPDLLETALRLPALLTRHDGDVGHEGDDGDRADGQGGVRLVPSRVGSLAVRGTPGERVRIAAWRAPDHAGRPQTHLRLTTPDGDVLAELHDVRLAPEPGRELSAEERQRAAESRYRTGWPERAHPAGPSEDSRPATGSWLLLADRGGVAGELAVLLRDRGHAVETLAPEPGELRSEPLAESLSTRLTEALRRMPPGEARGVVHLAALDLPDHPAQEAEPLVEAALTAASVPVTAVAAHSATGAGAEPARVTYVTRGAVRPERGGLPAPLQAPVHRLAGVAGVERPAVWGGVVDLDPLVRDPRADAAAVLAELLAADGEDHIAVRDGRRLAARVVRCAPPEPVLRQPELRADRTYLVAGDGGELARHVERWLTGHGAGRVVTPGVLTPDDGSGRQRATEAVKEAEECGAPVAGVVWLGADWNLRPADAAPPDAGELAARLRQRALGAWLLHDVCLAEGLELDLFVVFGSVASLWGAVGAGLQAAPDAVLTALAEHRDSLGLPVRHIAWAPWDGVGLLDQASASLLARSGLDPFPPPQALELLDHAMAGDDALSVAARADWSLLLPLYRQTLPWPLFADLAAEESAAPAGRGELLDRLRTLPSGERDDLLLDCVLEEASAVLGLDGSGELGPEQGFFELGMTSITVLEMRIRLERRFGCDLPATLAFECPTAAAVARHLATDVLELAGPGEPADGKRPAGPPAAVHASADTAPRQAGADASEDELLALLDGELAAADELINRTSP
ncbi:acyltransferase domain-containing protein [Streptomyces armeniacus]|uniref:Acyltransferase domain-containing protein n=1 Tax=Streptomyces armeniacus TaxID=83291 RepID=A0A345XJK9_9ACTN|nr:type I polyketide synthase [Streptomyces armeniacus]AXK31825.1 acyltransferase domain-containing protein [Streptomyces armeniacus]